MKTFFSSYRGALATLLLLILMPFIVGLFDSASPATVFVNGSGQSKFIQGLAIEIFILTENGNSLAGFVTFDLGKLVSGTGKKESFQEAFFDCGGIIAEVLEDGLLRVNDLIIPPPKGY